MKKKINEEIIATIISERAKGVGTARIAKMVGMSTSNIEAFITNVNRPQWMVDEENEKAAALKHNADVMELARQSREMHRNDRYYLAAA